MNPCTVMTCKTVLQTTEKNALSCLNILLCDGSLKFTYKEILNFYIYYRKKTGFYNAIEVYKITI